jgi:lipid II isoglutaminyl synthase (glutamine-hydrolysing)
MTATLRVCALYPDLMNIYADRGNIQVLRARCAWRGLGFELAASSLGEALDPGAHDLFYMGGGQDRDQIAVAEDMVATKRDALHAAADRGAVLLAVCGGYQLLGRAYQLGERTVPGIGLVGLETVREAGPRLIGNCAIEADLGTGPRIIAGFENHGRGRGGARADALGARQQRPRRRRGRPAQ